nr:hypothetical protein [Candidatus Bathyarchaeota archaeon]
MWMLLIEAEGGMVKAVFTAIRKEPLAVPVMNRLIVRYGAEYLRKLDVREYVGGLDEFEEVCMRRLKHFPTVYQAPIYGVYRAEAALTGFSKGAISRRVIGGAARVYAELFRMPREVRGKHT